MWDSSNWYWSKHFPPVWDFLKIVLQSEVFFYSILSSLSFSVIGVRTAWGSEGFSMASASSFLALIRFIPINVMHIQLYLVICFVGDPKLICLYNGVHGFRIFACDHIVLIFMISVGIIITQCRCLWFEKYFIQDLYEKFTYHIPCI